MAPNEEEHRRAIREIGQGHCWVEDGQQEEPNPQLQY